MKYPCSKQAGVAKDLKTCSGIYDLEKLTVHHVEKKKRHNVLLLAAIKGTNINVILLVMVG
jgi:hypothetical protein